MFPSEEDHHLVMRARRYRVGRFWRLFLRVDQVLAGAPRRRVQPLILAKRRAGMCLGQPRTVEVGELARLR